MQRQKKQLIAVIVVLVLFVLAYVGMYMYNGSQEKKEAASAEADKIYVTDVKADDITAFSYQLGEGKLTFTKAEDTWTCEEDTMVILDESKINTLLSNLEKLEAEEVVQNPDKLSGYGFDQPSNVITFTTKDGTTTLSIGMENKITSQYYVTKDSIEELYLVSTSMPTSFGKALQDLAMEDTETEQPEDAVISTEAE